MVSTPLPTTKVSLVSVNNFANSFLDIELLEFELVSELERVYRITDEVIKFIVVKEEE